MKTLYRYGRLRELFCNPDGSGLRFWVIETGAIRDPRWDDWDG